MSLSLDLPRRPASLLRPIWPVTLSAMNCTYPDQVNGLPSWENTSADTGAGGLPWDQARIGGATGQRQTVSITLDQLTWGDSGRPRLPDPWLRLQRRLGRYGPSGGVASSLWFDNFRLIDTGSGGHGRRCAQDHELPVQRQDQRRHPAVEFRRWHQLRRRLHANPRFLADGSRGQCRRCSRHNNLHRHPSDRRSRLPPRSSDELIRNSRLPKHLRPAEPRACRAFCPPSLNRRVAKSESGLSPKQGAFSWRLFGSWNRTTRGMLPNGSCKILSLPAVTSSDSLQPASPPSPFEPSFGCKPPNETPAALQLYSIRDDCAKDCDAALAWVAKAGFDGVEFAGYHKYSGKARDLRQKLDELNLKVVATHIGHRKFPGRYSPANDRLSPDHRLQVPDRSWRSRLTHPERSKALAELFNQTAATLKPLGMACGYHNTPASSRRMGTKPTLISLPSGRPRMSSCNRIVVGRPPPAWILWL